MITKKEFLSILSTILVLLFSHQIGFGQLFTKELLKNYAERHLNNKIKANLDSVLAYPELLGVKQTALQNQSIYRPLKNNSEEVIIDNTSESESEIHAAINPTDTSNIIVAAMRWGTNSDPLSSPLTFPVYYTNDFGETWQQSDFTGMENVLISLGGGDPIFSFDSNGRAYLTWLTVDGELDLENFGLSIGFTLRLVYSDDNGATWTYAEENIDRGTILDIGITDIENLGSLSNAVDKEWTAVDLSDSPYKNTFYVTYVDLDLVDTTYQIVLKKQHPTDSSLSERVNVSGEEIVFAQFASIDVDSKGNVHVLFAGATQEDVLLGLYHAISEDGGESFTYKRITDMTMPCFPEVVETCDFVGIDKDRMYPCPILKVDKSGLFGDRIYVAWTGDGLGETRTSGTDIYFTYSTDKGESWKHPSVLNDDSSPEAHQFFPSMTVNDKGVLVVTWHDRRNDPSNVATNHFITYSEDGGISFVPSRSVSTQSSDFSKIGQRNENFGIGEYTQVVATNSFAIPFWADGRTNDGNIEIYMAKVPLSEETMVNTFEVKPLLPMFSVNRIFPIPTNDIINIDFTLEKNSPIEILVYDMKGELVQSKTIRPLGIGNHLLPILLKSLSKGEYQCVIRTDFGVQTRGFVKL